MRLTVIYCLNSDTEQAKAMAADIKLAHGRAMIRNGEVFVPAHAVSCDRVLVLPGCDPLILKHYGEIAQPVGAKAAQAQETPARPAKTRNKE